MGEVYRATDIRLSQPVALKFLPEELSRDARSLDRFYNEVRIARQVAHSNVCRVFDLGEYQGQVYISMEFIDGEDLASLLRRIGRVPADKGMAMARQLCAGLAAAHDKGVLHRDLKPSNVMIDGRGQIRVMDFGLSALAGQVGGADIRSGTLAYMSPEQIAGREVTQRSDIYALGLVLYEIFAGKKPFSANTVAELQQLQSEFQPESLSTQVSDLDPAVERVIQRCLEPEPSARPASALSVAAALPGGDPLAAALAAGELPSPELVAAAGESTAMPVKWALACLAVLVAGFGWTAFMSHRLTVPGLSGLPQPPQVLEEKSRSLAARFGYSAVSDSAYGFETNHGVLHWLEGKYEAVEACVHMSDPQPSAVEFWYRQSPAALESHEHLPSTVGPFDPPLTKPGMVNVVLDRGGKLTRFEAVPPAVDDSKYLGQADWSALFEAAGLEQARFTAVEPKWHPLSGWDQRSAWEGDAPDLTGVKLRVEAAAWRGRPTYFRVIGPWSREEEPEDDTLPAAVKLVRLVLLVTVPAAVLFFAWQNSKRGRGDRRGAARLGWAIAISYVTLAMLSGHHTGGDAELGLIRSSVSTGAFLGGLVWLAYLALEPAVRRHWPQTLVSWTRLLAGRLRDPLVGAHILVGLAAGALLLSLDNVRLFAGIPRGLDPLAPSLFTTLGLRRAVAGMIAVLIINSAASAILAFFLLFLVRIVVRNERFAAVLFVVGLAIPSFFDQGHRVVNVAMTLVSLTIVVLLLLRFGPVAAATADFVFRLRQQMYLSLDWDQWYGATGALAFVAVALIAAFAFRSAMAGRSLFRDELFAG